MDKNKMNEYYKRDALSVIWDSTLIGLAFVGLKGEWVEVNPALCNLLGYSEVELQHMTSQDVTHPQDVVDDVRMVGKLISKDADKYTMTKRYITKHGNTVWAKLKVTPIFEDGDPTKKVGFFFSQILPFDVKYDEKEVKYLNERETFVPFLKNNWKWMLTSIGTIVLTVGSFFWNQQASITTLQTEVISLKVEMSHITESLDVIKGLLKK